MATYNGWNNYATFRVANDMLNNIEFDENGVTIDELKDPKPLSLFLNNKQ